jgi:GGDEF domain-containing protein
MESALSGVRTRLAEAEAAPGAFYCDYEFFKGIYRQKAREGSRTGQAVHLLLITITGGKNKEPDQKQLNHLVERLRGTIQSSLRNGDVFTRFSVAQFLLMLPSASYENVEMIMGRIGRNFRSSYPKANVTLKSSVLPLEPML